MVVEDEIARSKLWKQAMKNERVARRFAFRIIFENTNVVTARLMHPTAAPPKSKRGRTTLTAKKNSTPSNFKPPHFQLGVLVCNDDVFLTAMKVSLCGAVVDHGVA